MDVLTQWSPSKRRGDGGALEPDAWAHPTKRQKRSRIRRRMEGILHPLSRRAIHPEHRDQVLLLVPAWMAFAEKSEPLARIAGKGRIGGQASLELALELRILRQHLARLLLGHVGLHVFLLLEH